MVRYRRLLVALALICALAVSVGVVGADARDLRHRVSTQGNSIIGPTTGEPDVGGSKDPPRVPVPPPPPQNSYDPTPRQLGWDWGRQYKWMRLTSGIWLARNLGVWTRF